MSLSPGLRIGPYEVTAQIGAGGMGEVYRATDTRLKREVAVKVLPAALAADPGRLARFQREAEVLASLNNPNIAAIYGLEDAGGVKALVMELVEGPTLADRLANGAIPADEALSVARQMADALEAAHEQGIVHRDLKPANVKVRADGVVKVLDFGLAKLVQASGAEDAGGGPALSQSPTITTPALVTGAGVILGTAAYMSPEQARGREADTRSDIWAFGCVLYEMLTGTRAFAGNDVADVLASVIKSEVSWTALPASVPPRVRALLRRCLQKDARSRLRDIGDARIEIEEVIASPAAEASAAESMPQKAAANRWRRALPWASVTTVAVAAAIAATWYLRPEPDPAPELRLEVGTPRVGLADMVRFALSPDGRTLVYPGPDELWLRPLASDTARPIPGTESGTAPFWSPDGRSIGFYADQKLKRIDVASGSVQTLVDGVRSFGRATWGDDGTILYSLLEGVLYRVPATGAENPVEATRLHASQTSHRFPHFLPGSRRFLFFAVGKADVQGVYIGSLDSPETRRLLDVDHAAVFAPPDSVLFGRGEALYAQRLNPETLELGGDPQLVADRVQDNPGTAASVGVSASRSGLFAYRSSFQRSRELTWLDRQGRETGTLSKADGFGNTPPRISPDGSAVAIRRRTGGSEDVWLIETARGLLRRFATEGGAVGLWSPDSLRVAFSASTPPRTTLDLFWKSLDGGKTEALLESPESKIAWDWSPDGRFILYTSDHPKTLRDIWALPTGGGRKAFVVVQTQFRENRPTFDLNSRWIAYTSDETGNEEVYVQPFPGPGRSWLISTSGGSQPRWRGREIFYVAPDDRLMAATVTLDDAAQRVTVNAPVALFQLRPGSTYDVTRDGQRFLINAPSDDSSIVSLTVVVNWKPH